MTDTSRQDARAELSPLVISGLVELAAGAVSGFAMAATTYRPSLARRVGVQAPGRVRQLHLDLIMMGGLQIAVGAAVPQLPRALVAPLAATCWSNALAFAPVAIQPELERSLTYRGAVGASFVTAASSWVALAVIAVRRRQSSGGVTGQG